MQTPRDDTFEIPNLPAGFVGIWRKRVPNGIRFWEDVDVVGDDNHGMVGNEVIRRPGTRNTVVFVRTKDLAVEPGWHYVNGYGTLAFFNDARDPIFTVQLASTTFTTKQVGTAAVQRQEAMEALMRLLPAIKRVDTL